MTTHRCAWRVGLASACFALLIFFASGDLHGQNTTGTIRGLVSDSALNPVAGADVIVRNIGSGVERVTTTRENGNYSLPGLAPATYDLTVRKVGMGGQTRRVTVGIGQSLIINLVMAARPVELEELTVATAQPVVETRTSEVATNVTEQQIERLPTPSRNFLDLAVLAPGINVSEDRINGTGFRTFQGGGQSANSVNVFVDGTSLKNDLTGGGVTGQDASRGNPFPRNAIQEYRVISQNFKAEYQKASSAMITATTRSGGNQWDGNAFITYQDQGLVALDTFQLRDQAANPATFTEPDYERFLGGASVGGPIMRDKLHFFGSFEVNRQNRSNLVNFLLPATGTFPALDTVNMTQFNGNFTSPFREQLYFGKLTYAVSPRSTAELSFNHRHETDVRDFGTSNCNGGQICAFQQAVNFRQDVSVGQARYNYFNGPWFNEAKIDYSRFRRNPSPNASGLPQRVYQNLPGGAYVIGSGRSTQDFIQKRVGLRDDLTYSGFRAGGDHVLKMGASVDFLTYDIIKDNDGTPRFLYNDVFNYEHPFELNYGTGDPALNKKNTQIGLYVQDDWSPTPRLTINAGIRWDYETQMMNYDYVTPQNVVDTLTRYNDSLPAPLDLSKFISDGSSRDPFYGAFQPRLGFSYALDRDNQTTIFGAFGIYYDRTLFDVAVDETLKLTHPQFTIRFAAPGVPPGPGEVAWQDSYLTADRAVLDQLVGTFGVPEAWLISSDVKVPKSNQWNLGVRHLFGDVAVSVTYAGVRGVDQLTLNWANFGLNPNGSCCTSFNLGAHGFSNFIFSSNDAKTWYDALLVQIDRPYRRAADSDWGWGAGLSFTYAERKLEGVDALGDLFAFPNTQNIPEHPANDERARIVANWITDVPYLWGIQFSGLITLGSGNKQDIGGPIRFNPNGYVQGGFSPPGQNFLIFGKWVYRSVDLRLRKDLPAIGGTRLGLTLDAFNIFNYDNFGCFATPPNLPSGDPDPNLGTPGCVVSDPQRFQFGAEYDF
jgi:outer membrane receptor protein involved in Fe transport